MARRVRIVVIAEDRQQEMFARQLFYEHGFRPHDITFLTCPQALQSAFDWVLKTYADEARKLRARQHAQPNLGLCSMIDADGRPVTDRHEQLDEAGGHRADSERIGYLVPARNIETWLHALRGNEADEQTDYKRRGQPPVACKSEARAFVAGCRAAADRMLPSLRIACAETGRLMS